MMIEDGRVSAVVTGKISGRVRIRGPKGGAARGGAAATPAARPKRIRRPVRRTIREARPGGYKVISVSMPPADLAQIDAWAAACQMCRSRFLIAAAKHFATKLFP